MPAAKLTDQMRRPGEGSSVRWWPRGARARRACRGAAPSIWSWCGVAVVEGDRERRPRPRRWRRRRRLRSRAPASPPASRAAPRSRRGRAPGWAASPCAPGASLGRSGSIGSGSERSASSSRSSSWIAILGAEVFALAEVEPAQRAAGRPEEEAGPALAAVGVPELALGVDRDREARRRGRAGRRRR